MYLIINIHENLFLIATQKEMALPTHRFTDKILQHRYAQWVRKEIRKSMKQGLSHFDKVKFTKIYELFNGRAYRESFEMLVDDQLNSTLHLHCIHYHRLKDLFLKRQSKMLLKAPTKLTKNK